MNEMARGNISLRTLTGAALLPYLPALGELRVEVFRDWPYIYDGDAGYEETYLRTYADADRAAVICAFDGAELVGAATCLPLAAEPAHMQQPLAEAGFDVAAVFYFGESVLRKTYRGQGIGVAFFEAREAHARKFGMYETAAFCAVQRAETHKLKPAGFVPLDAFWGKRGYTKQPNLQCRLSWRDVGETAESEKTLTFWTKPL
jgi:GNAT superfamily N-acetyltransferase